MSGRCAASSLPNTIPSPGGITFRLVDLVNCREELSRSEDQVRDTTTEFARWTIIVTRGVLNIGECSNGNGDDRNECENSFHRGLLSVKGFRTAKAILYFGG